VKSPLSTPPTVSENVTRHTTLEAEVAAEDGLSRVIDETAGAIVSIVTTKGADAGLEVPPVLAVAENVCVPAGSVVPV
jgi:hypothetical protein